jgi:mono/diheme cytochrome c family protein
MRGRSPIMLALACLMACSPKAEPSRPPVGADTAADTAARALPAPPVDSQRVTAPAPAAAPARRPTSARPSPAPAPAAPTTPKPTVAAAGAAPARDQWHPPPRDTLDGETYQGWKQFELNCSRCHGEYAVGTSFAPALVVSLKEGGTIPTKEAFITTVCAGRTDKGMPAWCALGLEMSKIEQMYLYVKGRADGKYAAGRPALRE